MTQEEMLWIATWSNHKRYDYETLKYCDYMNGHEDLIDDVWEYVEEIQEIGRLAFYEKYKEFKLY